MDGWRENTHSMIKENTITTDYRSSYKNLCKHCYIHKTVNRTNNFVDPVSKPFPSAQNLEIAWQDVCEAMSPVLEDKNNTSRFTWKNFSKRIYWKQSERFHILLLIAVKLYSPH